MYQIFNYYACIPSHLSLWKQNLYNFWNTDFVKKMNWVEEVCIVMSI